MHIAFVLPGPSRRPTGGYKVAFAYASALRARGHEVDLIVPRFRGDRRRWAPIARVVWPLITRLPSRPRWHPQDNDSWVREVVALSPAVLKCFDVVIATGWDTAEDLGKVRPDGRGCAYLIQGFEDWTGDRQRVTATWRLPFRRIVIAKWLADLAAELDALPVAHVPNAIDTGLFRCIQPVSERDPRLVGMILHPDAVKGSAIGLRALALAREHIDDLRVLAFSAYDQPIPNLPPWLELTVRPSAEELVTLYNRIAVFLSPSHSEGWALPPAEAMACGAALVSSDIGGVRDYASDGETALLTPVDDPNAMGLAVVGLLTDPDTRRAIAERGMHRIRHEFSWRHSTELLETVLHEVGNSREP